MTDSHAPQHNFLAPTVASSTLVRGWNYQATSDAICLGHASDEGSGHRQVALIMFRLRCCSATGLKYRLLVDAPHTNVQVRRHTRSTRSGNIITMARATYTKEQVHQIYDRINLPKAYRHNPGEDDGLKLLSALQRHHLANVPFENLELHYSPTKVINTDAELLFQKIVTQNTGRGGYCMENNLFFGTLLRSLGFCVMSTGGRVNMAAQPSGDVGPEEHFTGFSHMVNIVTIQGKRYMVDVGFGTGQATHPLELVNCSPSMNVKPSQRVRLRWDAITEIENKDAKVWIFERQDKADGPWIPTYCFPDNVEFLPQDYMVMSHFGKI